MVDFQSFWQRRGALNIALLPASALFAAAAALRRTFTRPAAHTHLPPVVVVGNVVVGGSGKTPVVIALAQALAARGWRPGILCRGVGGKRRRGAARVTADMHWRECGDEALLLQRRTQMPVCFSRQRVQAAELLAQEGCDVILSDDGLQHTALPRAAEICVTDATYRFGNGWLLPAGPLRESPARAARCTAHLLVDSEAGNQTADSSAFAVPKQITHFYPLADPQQRCAADFFHDKCITALAGIARPQVFFNALQRAGLTLNATLPLADHAATSLHAIRSEVILMTEKDAVKYTADDVRLYAAAVECTLPPQVIDLVENALPRSRPAA